MLLFHLLAIPPGDLSELPLHFHCISFMTLNLIIVRLLFISLVSTMDYRPIKVGTLTSFTLVSSKAPGTVPCTKMPRPPTLKTKTLRNRYPHDVEAIKALTKQ